MWPALAVSSFVVALGAIVFGRFEAGTPRWRRVLKLALFVGLSGLLARSVGPLWAWGWIGAAALLGLSVHFLWCHRHRIDPWTAEPWDRYSELRGWTTVRSSAAEVPHG